MRILYGANSQGQGHLSKAATLVPLLVSLGHEVRVITSGPAVPGDYCFGWHRHYPGLPYEVRSGRIDIAGTLRSWVRNLPAVVRGLRQVRRVASEFEPDLILTDFELLTASPLLGARCEVVSVCRQAALFDPEIALPPTAVGDARLSRTLIRIFTCGADRYFGYHYVPASQRCLPLVVRKDLLSATPHPGEHLLVYCHYDDPQPLVEWANRRRVPVRAYGYHAQPRGQVGYVQFQPSSRSTLIDDLRTARAVVTNAGLTTPVEAFLLRKPVCVVPIPGQWEQLVNAFHLHEAGIATHLKGWDFDTALNTVAAADDHPARSWLGTDPLTIAARLTGQLGQQAGLGTAPAEILKIAAKANNASKRSTHPENTRTEGGHIAA